MYKRQARRVDDLPQQNQEKIPVSAATTSPTPCRRLPHRHTGAYPK